MSVIYRRFAAKPHPWEKTRSLAPMSDHVELARNCSVLKTAWTLFASSEWEVAEQDQVIVALVCKPGLESVLAIGIHNVPRPWAWFCACVCY